MLKKESYCILNKENADNGRPHIHHNNKCLYVCSGGLKKHCITIHYDGERGNRIQVYHADTDSNLEVIMAVKDFLSS